MLTETALKLKKVLQGEIYADLVKWLVLQITDMRDINNVRHCSKAADQAVELKAQVKAYERLHGIFSEIIEVPNIKDPLSPPDPSLYGLGKEDIEK
ncbi:MAG: hypothetical protein WCV88_06120 [Patescibacteria group bacterium]|jgi:hypothetical protein